MKKCLVFLLIVSLIAVAGIFVGCGKSGPSGTYEGVLPAADCPGLDTSITFNSDGTFYMEETFIERDESPTITEGEWSLEGDIITLSFDDTNYQYKLVSNKEIKWVVDGKEIEGTDLNWSLMKK